MSSLSTTTAAAHAAAPPGRRRRRALLAAALPLAVALAALPSAAHAGTAAVTTGGQLLYYDESVGSPGAPQQQNDVTVAASGFAMSITDPVGIRNFADGQCDTVSATQIVCRRQHLQVSLNDGADEIRWTAPEPGSVDLGAGHDVVHGGQRASAPSRPIQPVVYAGGAGPDLITYADADRGVTADLSGAQESGRPGVDRETVREFSVLQGSRHDDVLLGSADADTIIALGGDDVVAGGHGDDAFLSFARDGADDYHGGPGRDLLMYTGRTAGVNVSLDNVRNDGEPGEADQVRSNVENLTGGSGNDTLASRGAFSVLDGGPGNDTLLGEDGPDTLIGGPGRDTLHAGSGNDAVEARDGERDVIDCSSGTDALTRDASESSERSCEQRTVGVLRLTPQASTAAAGKVKAFTLSWRHPRAWRKLDRITVRFTTKDGASAGAITIRPRQRKIADGGFVDVGRSRMTRRGATVSVRMPVRFDEALAGESLRMQVEARDTAGRRQLVRQAGTVKVA